jgi:hypothetical protein
MEKSLENELKTNIEELISTLKEAGKDRLAACIELNWHKSVLTYSRELHTYKPTRPMDKELVLAFNI